MKKAGCLHLGLLIFFAAYSQQPNLYFKRITVENGLSNNKVNCILQDHRGFMWIGTDDGLNRYDGHNFRIFRNDPLNPQSVSGNIIKDLYEDSGHVLWVATADGGLSSYDFRLAANRQFTQYKHIPGDSNSLPINIINAITEDASGYLWLGTGGESVIRFRKETGEYEIPVAGNTKTILDLCQGRKGMIWAGRAGGGLLQINADDLSFREDRRYRDLYATLPHATITSLYCDRDNTLWLGSWDKLLYRYNPDKGTEITYRNTENIYSFSEDEILCFASDSGGRIWMGGSYEGLQVFDPGSGRFFHYRHDPSLTGSVADNQVNCICIDRSGRKWLGTAGGVSVLLSDQSPFTQSILPAPKGKGSARIYIYDYYRKSSDELWIGTSAGICIRKNNGQLSWRPVILKGKSLAVTCFYEDVNGDLYIGTNLCVLKYNRGKDRFQPLPDKNRDKVMNDIIDSRVLSIIRDTVDHRPVLLASAYGHYLAYYDLVEEKWISRLDTNKRILQRWGLEDNLIRKFYRSRNGSVWMANSKAGLGLWNRAEPVRYFRNIPGNTGSLSSNNVQDIREDSSGRLWISTYGGGLHYFDINSRQSTHISASENLGEGIQVDDHGSIWMIANGTLHRYQPRSNRYTSYTLPDLENKAGISGRIYEDLDGFLFVSGPNYFIRFHPDSVPESQPVSRVEFTDFSILNQSYNPLLFGRSIRLDYTRNHFTIEFAAPYFPASGEVRYSYQLEGFDKDWIEAGSRHFASYNNLPGKIYRFRVRASAAPGQWNEAEASLLIEVIPPFWTRWWFFSLCGIILALLIYGIFLYRINEFMKRQAIRNKIARDLHDNIGSGLSSISVYSEVARMQQERGNPAALEKVLSRIGQTAGEMITEMNDMVWAINPQNDSMEKILSRMEHFARPQFQERDKSFEFDYDPGLLNLGLSMEKRNNLYLIFKEAITNAIKYADADIVAVEIRHSGKTITLTVTDDGKGFVPGTGSGHPLSGNGILNMERRTAEMKGEFHLESLPGKGTTVWLRFPVP